MTKPDSQLYHDLVRREQEKVQKLKFQGRLLGELDLYVFFTQNFTEEYREKYTSEVEEFLIKKFGEGIGSIADLLSAIHEQQQRRILWTDMGCGRALAMRQIAGNSKIRGLVEMIGVDLKDWDLSGLTDEEIEYLEKNYPGITNPNNKPTVIRENVESVQISEPIDLITSFESIQYLNNPLMAICNWYNLLADNGYLLIATGHIFTDWIRYEGLVMSPDKSPFDDLRDIFHQNDIDFAGSESYTDRRRFSKEFPPEGFRTIIIQKKPNTHLVLNAELAKIYINPDKLKSTSYDNNPPLISVLFDSPPPKLFTVGYYAQMRKIFEGS